MTTKSDAQLRRGRRRTEKERTPSRPTQKGRPRPAKGEDDDDDAPDAAPGCVRPAASSSAAAAEEEDTSTKRARACCGGLFDTPRFGSCSGGSYPGHFGGLQSPRAGWAVEAVNPGAASFATFPDDGGRVRPKFKSAKLPSGGQAWASFAWGVGSPLRAATPR